MASVNFLCTQCDARLSREWGEPASSCESCGAPSPVAAPPSETILDRCAACAHEELYFQKDFNRKTGIALVVIGSILAPFTHYISLVAVTLLDWTIWRMVKNVIVCYRCQAVHRGYPQNPALQPFDLATHDRHVYGAAPPGAEEKQN